MVVDHDIPPDHYLAAEAVNHAQHIIFCFVHVVLDEGCRNHDAQGLDDDAQGFELDAQGFLDEEAPGQIVTVTETHDLPPPPAPTSRPGQGWECSGSGSDGCEVDWQGNGCPSHLPSGWKWWGVSIAWGPSKGWDCRSNWTPSPAEVDSPSASWTCDGTGRDGYDFDHFGNGRPSYLPVGWKRFGQLHGWQPCSSFQLPSSTWSPPSSWNPNLAVWWQPRAAWTLRGNFRCPRWWNRGHLRGSFRWW
ncbi:hypothetical protein JCM10020v2_000711 [Rhodotorula toruloides]